MNMPRYFTIFALLLLSLNSASAREIRFIGVNGDLLLNVERHVRLVKRLRDKNIGPMLEGEQRRLESRVESEVKQALEPFGYYNVEVRRDHSQGTENYRYLIALNKPVMVNSLKLELGTKASSVVEFQDWRNRFPLTKGLPLNQVLYSTQKKALLSTAIRLGFFDAQYSESKIVINEQRTLADISLRFVSGARYSLGDITIDWNLASTSDQKSKQGIEQSILDSLITIKPGQSYTADALSKTQRNLLATPYFSAVDVRAGEREPQALQIPVKITLTPSKRKAYNFAIGAGTDTGIRASVGYENRRINRQGHNISVRAGGSEIKRTAILNYRIPLARTASDSLNFFTSLDEEFGDTRRFQSARIGSEWAFEWRDSLFKLGLVASREKFIRREDDLSEIENDTDLILPSLFWERTKGDDVYFPTKGWSAAATVRGASQSIGSDIDLAQAIFKGKLLRPLGSGRVKLRVHLAGSIIDDAADLPESLGFLAGGDDSVRGYDFESIGVDRNSEINVAKNLFVASIEYEHPIKNGFALAAFLDAGDAFDSGLELNKGAGLGLRWRLPFGALRLDAASALDLEGDPVRLHFSFGTDL